MKIRLFVAAMASLALVAGSVLAADKEFKASCPVSGKAASQDNAVAFKGKEVYFCCENCPTAFKANSDKFALARRAV